MTKRDKTKFRTMPLLTAKNLSNTPWYLGNGARGWCILSYYYSLTVLSHTWLSIGTESGDLEWQWTANLAISLRHFTQSGSFRGQLR